jgi:methyltransferase (TIGR00027 family)
VRPGRASKTAEHNALFRALEARWPAGERVVLDPLAEAFLSLPLRAVAAAAQSRVVCNFACRIIDARWPGVRTSVVARTWLIDELVCDSVAGSPQLIILGAGYDTRAWRLDCLRDTDTVFEVDHPDTQLRKRAVLARCGVSAAHVRFVSTDFHLERLATAMEEQGYCPSRRTVFLWEGTTNYLDDAAVDATLRWCARAVPASRLIFTYINDDVLEDPTRYVGAQRVFASLGRMDERMTFGISPDRLASYLDERGLCLEDDVSAAEYRTRFYGARARRMQGHEFYRVAVADVR